MTAYRFQRYRMPLIAGVLLAGLILAPCFASRTVLLRATEIAYFIALAQLWNLLAGYAGLMSIGQQLFIGVGAYTFYAASIQFGLPVWLALPLAAVLSALAAIPSALLLFRLRGAYFAIGSWVLADCLMLLVSHSDTLGGASGMSLPAVLVRRMAASTEMRAQLLWWLALGLALTSILLVYLWLRSRHGLALMALRDNDKAAVGLGVDTGRLKFAVYLVVAALTGMVGALIFLNKLRLSPSAAFSLSDWTASVIFIVVIGGIGSIEGPLVGAFVFFALREIFADYGAWYNLLLGAIAIAVMLFLPKGVWSLLAEKLGWRLFAVRRQADAP